MRSSQAWTNWRVVGTVVDGTLASAISVVAKYKVPNTFLALISHNIDYKLLSIECHSVLLCQIMTINRNSCRFVNHVFIFIGSFLIQCHPKSEYCLSSKTMWMCLLCRHLLESGRCTQPWQYYYKKKSCKYGDGGHGRMSPWWQLIHLSPRLWAQMKCRCDCPV